MSLQTRLTALVSAIGADIKNLNTQVGSLSSTGTTTTIDGGAAPSEAYTGVVVSSGGAIHPSMIDAKGDLIAGSSADSVARLPVGVTTGHVLTVDPLSSVGISWQAPAVDSVTSVNARTGAVTGLAEASDIIPKAVVDAKGDILIASAADTVTRLPVGANGTVLTADSAEATGVKWTVASGRTELIVAADQVIQHATAGTFVDITGLSLAVAANTTYEIEGIIWFTVVATTTGHRWGFVGPGLALANIVMEYQTSATAWATYDQQHNNTTMTGVPPMTTTTASGLAGVPNILRVKGLIRNGATAGTLKMQGASELNSASVTVLKGSTLTYKTL